MNCKNEKFILVCVGFINVCFPTSNYKVSFNAAGSFTETKKMLLLK